MAQNCRFAFGVHVMSVLALVREGNSPQSVVASEHLAATVNTNPVVIRRLLLDLREAGLIETHRGPGGGAKLSRGAHEISLLDIHRAVSGEIEAFGEHPNEPSQKCCVGREIRHVLHEIAGRAREAVEREYAAISLAEVAAKMDN